MAPDATSSPLHDDDPVNRPTESPAGADEILGDEDAPVTETLVPETQGEDPLEADLGDEGQGDLAAEDATDPDIEEEITQIVRGSDPDASG